MIFRGLCRRGICQKEKSNFIKVLETRKAAQLSLFSAWHKYEPTH